MKRIDSQTMEAFKRCTMRIANKTRPQQMNRRSRRRAAKLSQEEHGEVAARGILRCRSCGMEKTLAEFGTTRAGGRTYVRRGCRTCEAAHLAHWRNENQRRIWECNARYKCKRYGITLDQYRAMLQEQRYLCANCGQSLPERGHAIDHDHRTGMVRGIVHSHCNLVIGNAGESIELLGNAIRYLECHRMRPSPQQTSKSPDHKERSIFT